MYEYNAKIYNIVDGDTFDVDIDLGFHIHIHERIRVLDLDTPECRGKEKQLGLIVKEYVNKHFLGADVVIKSKSELTPKTDSFGRWLCDVTLNTGESIRDILTELGFNKYDSSFRVGKILTLNSDK